MLLHSRDQEFRARTRAGRNNSIVFNVSNHQLITRQFIKIDIMTGR